MTLSANQRRIARDSLLAIVFCALVLAAGVVWLPASILGLEGHLGPADRLVFALSRRMAAGVTGGLRTCCRQGSVSIRPVTSPARPRAHPVPANDARGDVAKLREADGPAVATIAQFTRAIAAFQGG